MLDDIRANDKYRWPALARQCRIRSSAEEAGLTDSLTRKKAIIKPNRWPDS
jgi:hypothetical protein